LAPDRGHTVKISNLKKQDGGGRHLEKSTKLIAISQPGIDRSSRRVSQARRPLKNLNFQNPRWRTADIVKTVKSPYLRNRLTDFDEIWQGDTHFPHT